MSDPKTVSDLPVDVSIRWANDQKLLEETHPIIKDSRSISEFTQKDVTSPAIYSQLDLLLEMSTTSPTWALFAPPTGFFDQRKRLFTSRVLPVFESEEQIDNKIQKVTSVLNQEDEEKDSYEKKALINMLKQLITINKNLLFIMSRRNQYQKG